MIKRHVKMNIGVSFYNSFFTGGGKGGSEVSEYTIKDSKGCPYVPGSMLKGALRHNVEMIQSRGSKDERLMADIFGRPGNVPAQFMFDDLKLDDSLKNHAHKFLKVRECVQMNRFLKTSKDDSLFSIQAFDSGDDIWFKGSIEGFSDYENYKRHILSVYIAFQMLNSLGGCKSRGFGWIENKRFELLVDGEHVDIDEMKRWGEEIEI